MNDSLYVSLKAGLVSSAEVFIDSEVKSKLKEEVDDDISTIVEVFDISKWKTNVDGVEKNFSRLLAELNESNSEKNKQGCIESIAMLRVAISNIESAYSNAMDSMEHLIVAIRDGERDLGSE